MLREAGLSLDHSPADSAGSGTCSGDTLAAQLSVADQGGQKVHFDYSFGEISICHSIARCTKVGR